MNATQQQLAELGAAIRCANGRDITERCGAVAAVLELLEERELRELAAQLAREDRRRIVRVLNAWDTPRDCPAHQPNDCPFCGR